MSRELRTCRFCRRQDFDLVHYGTRAYAHTKCLVDEKGEEFLLTLPVGTLGRVAVFQVSATTRERIMDILEADRAQAT